jgi:quinol monooxygenase YgiN
MKVITVFFTAKKDKRVEVIELCKGMIAPSRSESGCISYNFYQDMTDENKFFFFEEWKDQQAIDIHVKTEHYIAFEPKFDALIMGKADLQVRTITN